MKVLRLVESDGHVWEVPLTAIAEDRGNYYGNRTATFNQEEYDEEYNLVMTDNYEAYDWFVSNMNWEDVAAVSKLVEKPAPKSEPDINEIEDYGIFEADNE